MDSLTHLAMGVAIGEVVLGKTQGRKAWLWGAVLASFPDIDVCFTWLFSPGSALLFHRGMSHSILFCLLLAFLSAHWLNRLYKGDKSTYKGWLLLAFCGLFSHIFIDIFNSYSVALFWPFHTRVVFDSIGIFDGLFFLPFFLACIAIFLLKRKPILRRKLAITAITMSTCYLGFTAANKLSVQHNIREQLVAEGKDVGRVRAAPLPLTNFAWMVLAEDKSGKGFWQTSYITTSKQRSAISYIPKQEELVHAYENDKELKRLKRFSKGFYAIAKDSNSGKDYFCDLRFPSFDFDGTAPVTNAVVKLELKTDANGRLNLDRTSPHRKVDKDRVKNYWHRIFGKTG